MNRICSIVAKWGRSMRRYFQKELIKLVFRLLSFIPDTVLVWVINLVERLGYARNLDKEEREELKTVKEAIRARHPWVRLVRGICSKSAKCRDKLIANIFVTIYSREARKNFAQTQDSPAPFFFVISPTMRCNLRCIGCYAGSYDQREELSFDIIDRIFNDGKEMGIYFITVSGGEPFIRNDFLTLCRKHNDLYFQVYTNGTLIDERLAKEIANLGNIAVCISVEGFEEETDYRRGRGTFNKIIRAMENLEKEGVIFGISGMPTRYNASIFASEEFYKFYLDQGCSFCWLFQYIPVGRNPDVNLMATPEQRLAIRNKTREVRNKYPIFIGDFWNDGDFTKGCIAAGARGGYFHINAKGDVEPCVFVHFAADNIKDIYQRGGHLSDALKSDFFQAIRAGQPFNQDHRIPCMIIDNPQCLRNIVEKTKPYPTSQEMEPLICHPRIIEHLDNYAQQMREILKSG